MDEQQLKQTFANNLIYYRKKNGLTQLELAEKLSYSDKSISKWERAEGLPDLVTMYKLAEIFDITLNDLTDVETKHSNPTKILNLTALSLIISGFVWLCATFLFVLFTWLFPNMERQWLSFIYAIPATLIVLIVFGAIEGKKWHLFTYISVLVWIIILSVYLTIDTENIALIFIMGIPCQAIVIFAMFIKKPMIKEFISNHTPKRKGDTPPETTENESNKTEI